MKKLYFLFAVVLLFVSGNAQIINFPDANLKAKLLQSSPSVEIAKNSNGTNIKIDSNNDSQIQVSEALAVFSLFVSNANITDLTGITSFANVSWFDCSGNSLTNVNLTGLNLWVLNVSYNQLTTLDVSGFPNMSTMGCAYNNLTSLNLSNLSNLGTIDCSHNQITNINFPNSTANLSVFCNNNLITDIDFSQPNKLIYLDCSQNSLTNLDISGSYMFETTIGAYQLNLTYNESLVSLNIKNGKMTLLGPNNNLPNLRYLCIDPIEIGDHTFYDAPSTCVINSYCSFTPGGLFYTVEGAIQYDYDNNGCDEFDPIIPYVNFAITNGTVTGNLLADLSGNYTIPVQAGTHTITPILETPSYFTVSSSNTAIAFPSQASPYIQNFCISPNGSHNDLEVNLIPINAARPGFTSIYKITYKNKGTQPQSGSVTFSFNDTISNLISTNPVFSSQMANLISWDFSNLLPFESGQIIIELHLNSPMEIPPVNGGDILNFTASVNSSLTDETPNDNTFTLNQTVVNSFDPNDKNCLQGNTITPEMVGKDVHYLIRFENTGTANAENVVVKDMIDTTKFDINSLIPIDGSHPFVTKISNSNRVEFIFENINLPFDDANNDGYVAFKIKTKPTLVLGDSFSNTANIYFDYNFPIVTDPAVTTVALLANSDFVFENYFSIYPNPANTTLNIETKQTIAVTSINIYNTLGQVVLVIPNAQQTKSVDVSSLKTGNYFLKINSDKGSSSVKFVKL